MGEVPWGKESPSNIHAGGNFRRAGENEPDVLKAKGLSEAEIAVREKAEAFSKKELEFLEKTLMELNWRAADVLENKKALNMVARKMPADFRYFKLREHLEELAEIEEEKRRPARRAAG